MADASGNIFTVTVVDPKGDTQAIELHWISRALHLAAHESRRHGGTKTSGDILADGRRVIGRWSYTPTAAR